MTQRVPILLLAFVSVFVACGTCIYSKAFAQKNLPEATSAVLVDSFFISVQNEAVQVWLDKATGQFWVSRESGGRMLFADPSGGTSATSVHLNGATFTNNRLRAPQPPVGTQYMPDGIASIVDDTLVFVTAMQHERATVQLIQKFVLMIEGDYGYVRIITTVTNTSQTTVDVGLQNLFDLYILDTDVMTVTIDSIDVRTESQWFGASMPDRYEASATHVPWKIIARLSGSGTTPPDILTVGNWRYGGYLGAPAWDYTPSGLPLAFDNATLLQWNEQPLQPGASRSVVTDYGVQISRQSSLSCTADELRLNFTEDGYDPDPFRVIAHITNTGELELRDMPIRIVLPSDIRLATGETLARTIIGPLTKGQSIPVSWNLHADTSSTPRSRVILVILDDGMTIDTCKTELAIPAIPQYALETQCPEDVYLELTDDRLGYKNADFTIETRVRNIGNVALNSITALMQPPSILQLEGSAEFQFLEPDQILPGLESVVSWQLRASPQCKDTVVELRITLQRMPFYEDTCVLRVHFPATRQTACVPNGILTRGTSFHSSLLYNDATDDGLRPQAVLYIMTDSTSHVTVTEEMTGYRYEFTVNACDAQTVVLSDSANSLLLPVFETIERRSVTITATYPVTVIAGSLRRLHSDATLLLPDHALGREYVTLGYNYSTGSETEHFSIVASDDNTQIDYRLWARSNGSIPGRTPQQLNLNTSETFAIHQGLGGPAGGLTGSTISATHPIGLVSGMSGGHIPGWGTFLEFKNPVLHQVPPIEHFGKEYVVAPFRSRQRGYTIRVVASEPGTNIVVGSQPHTLTNKGDRFETQLLDPTLISADKPILVAQFGLHPI